MPWHARQRRAGPGEAGGDEEDRRRRPGAARGQEDAERSRADADEAEPVRERPVLGGGEGPRLAVRHAPVELAFGEAQLAVELGEEAVDRRLVLGPVSLVGARLVRLGQVDQKPLGALPVEIELHGDAVGGEVRVTDLLLLCLRVEGRPHALRLRVLIEQRVHAARHRALIDEPICVIAVRHALRVGEISILRLAELLVCLDELGPVLFRVGEHEGGDIAVEILLSEVVTGRQRTWREPIRSPPAWRLQRSRLVDVAIGNGPARACSLEADGLLVPSQPTLRALSRSLGVAARQLTQSSRAPSAPPSPPPRAAGTSASGRTTGSGSW